MMHLIFTKNQARYAYKRYGYKNYKKEHVDLLKLQIYWSSYLGPETEKRPFRSSIQAATCYCLSITTK